MLSNYDENVAFGVYEKTWDSVPESDFLFPSIILREDITR